jgi:hypothetical protein
LSAGRVTAAVPLVVAAIVGLRLLEFVQHFVHELEPWVPQFVVTCEFGFWA